MPSLLSDVFCQCQSGDTHLGVDPVGGHTEDPPSTAPRQPGAGGRHSEPGQSTHQCDTCGGPEQEHRLKVLFQVLDVNGDGGICVNDLTIGLKKLGVHRTEHELRWSETTFHTLEDGGVVEYCTTTVSDSTPTMVAAVEAPVEMLAASSASPPPPQSHAKPQELKSRIALNSARLLQEQRVTNVHIRQIAQHMEGQNELLQMMRRSQEAQAFAQERQAQALEGTQAALLALVQLLKPALKDLRKFLQSGTEASNSSSSTAEQQRSRTPPPPQPAEEAQ
ncbi:nuclear apoptosis-inducing factor 1-like [Notothenia coriiceps]|uniref:Nuclear apoptosis-inducing factor 1-like n=1 Tax=Notothenia coriiceps TaxID=8208 RepID=A0A6I9N208_9TELE|nr:PREDICTED: nuclear apoptosis-inducing factor 1-like [Notothenia coriiceps]